MPPLSVVIPVYNEEARVAAGVRGAELLRSLLDHPVEVILVDDGSEDRTVEVAEPLCRGAGAPIRLLREPHRGKGGAVRAGVMASTGDRILVTDVDWSVGPRHLAGVLADTGDVVCAVREGAGARRLGEPEWRHTLGRVFNWLVQGWVLSGHQDTQCGCKLLTRAAADALMPRLTIEGWAYDVELLYLAHVAGFRVTEVPVVWVFERESRLDPVRDGLKMAWELRRIQANARRGVYRTP
jgi:dolichyl-phosphate beta-glucosyltransferase